MQRRSMEVAAVPVVTAPSAPCSSPRTAAADHLPAGYCYFFSSAPTSPSRGASGGDDVASPGDGDGDGVTFDFTLGFGGRQLQEATPVLAAADELFEGGRIRPLNAPHPSVLTVNDDECAYSSSRSFPRSPGRAGGEDRAAEASARGRRPAATTASAAASARSRRATRSLSPFRGGGSGGGEDESSPSSPPSSPRASMMRGCGSGSKKWRLKDFFPFHSASDEGRSKDRLLFKYAVLPSSSSHPAAQKLSTSVDGTASSMRKGRGQSTAAPSEQNVTRRRTTTTTTPLPLHRNSLFGYLRSNPAIHSISRKLGNHHPPSSNSTSNRGGRFAARSTSATTHASTTTTTCPD